MLIETVEYLQENIADCIDDLHWVGACAMAPIANSGNTQGGNASNGGGVTAKQWRATGESLKAGWTRYRERCRPRYGSFVRGVRVFEVPGQMVNQRFVPISQG